MREIKFRAWNGKYMIDATFGEWVSFDGVPYTQAEETYNTPNIEIEKAKTYIIMQYTGLNDKNGKEIYEGDILLPNNREVVYIDNGEYSRGVGFYTVCHRVDGNCRKTPFTLCQTQTEYAKIIGNIYENPELLKDNK